MARRKWIKLWCYDWLEGTLRDELEPDERSVWADLLAMAGDSPYPGTICVCPEIGYTPEQLCKKLKISENLYQKSIQKMSISYNGDEPKISVNSETNVITINKFRNYQSDWDLRKDCPSQGSTKKPTSKPTKKPTSKPTSSSKKQKKKKEEDKDIMGGNKQASSMGENAAALPPLIFNFFKKNNIGIPGNGKAREEIFEIIKSLPPQIVIAESQRLIDREKAKGNTISSALYFCKAWREAAESSKVADRGSQVEKKEEEDIYDYDKLFTRGK